MIEPGSGDDTPVDPWDDEYRDIERTDSPILRKPLLVVIAAVTAAALALVPVYNVFTRRTIADNGLEVCGYDYCIVQEAMRRAGLDLVMSRLSNTFLDEAQARALADELTDHLGVDPVGLVVVDDLEGLLGGFYDPANRSIQIERPARVWTVIHETAHVVENGHADEFQALVADLARWVDGRE